MNEGNIEELAKADDLVPIILYKSVHRPNKKKSKEGMYISNLFQTLKEIDYTNYGFDNNLLRYYYFEDALEMFDNIGVVERDKNNKRIKLTSKGVELAKKLASCLEDYQAVDLLYAIKRGKQYAPNY